MVSFSNASATLISEATPAARPTWPMLPLTDPSAQPPGTGSPCRRNAEVSAATSIWSPSGLPTACASTMDTSWLRTPASDIASAITAACPRTLGAANPTDVPPSLVTAVARMTARMWSRSASASLSRFSSTMPAPDVYTTPEAALSNGRHRPSRLSVPSCSHQYPWPNGTSRSTPPASASSHSPARSAAAARCTVTSELEQAAATAMLGPRRPSL